MLERETFISTLALFGVEHNYNAVYPRVYTVVQGGARKGEGRHRVLLHPLFPTHSCRPLGPFPGELVVLVAIVLMLQQSADRQWRC